MTFEPGSPGAPAANDHKSKPLRRVSPLRGAGLLRCASSRCQRPIVSPLTGGHPSRGLADTLRARWRAERRQTAALGAWPVRSPMQRLRLRLHRDAEQPGQAGDAGGLTTAARARARGSRPRRCAARTRGSACARSSHRAPPSRAPVKGEGDLWGDLQAVGRGTGSLLRLRRTPPIPNPFP